MIISSKDNPLIKKFRKLEKSRERKESGLFVVEGIKEIQMALHNKFSCETLLLNETEIGLLSEFKSDPKINIQFVSTSLFETLTYRGTASKAMGIFKAKEQSLDSLSLSKTPFVIILESVEKPGNLGAVIRTADACGADAVIVCDALTDFYNPNVIRSSVGTVFSKACVAASKELVFEWLTQQNIQVFTTFIEDSIPYTQADFRRPCALVAGTEATGLSPFWRKIEAQNIVIPMLGQNDSLNVSVATAVIAFEVVRQRKLQS
jgi:TrmH family RNA methyltransferase